MTMTTGELKTLHFYLDNATHYLEFGSGASTIHSANLPNLSTIDSVESSADYVDNFVKTESGVNEAISAGKLTFHIINIGKTKNWGVPADDSSRELWPNYSKSIFSKPNSYDLVLVDGRFRVACVLNSILNTSPECIIVVHDFWNRPEYHVVLEHLDVEAKADTLVVCRKKPNFDSDKIKQQIEIYQYLPEDKTAFDRIKGLFQVSTMIRAVKKLKRILLRQQA